jgi:tetratricopeptide (TPR) repeat protein
MKYASICIALAVIVAPCAGQATSQPEQAEIDSANRLFEVGKFAEAGELYARIVAQNPTDYSANFQLGRIALLSNQLDDAQKWLEEAIALQPRDDDAKVMLAEAFYRRDDFQRAAASLNGVEISTNKLVTSQYPTLNVAKLESFKNQTPYDVHGNEHTTRLIVLEERSAAVGQRARKRRRRGHLLHRYRGFGGRAGHGLREGAWSSAIRGGARHLFWR